MRDVFADQFGVAGRYDSLDALLAAETVDVVHLCTPPGLHRDQAIAALRGGAHVVCEKPPVLSLADLDAVLEVAHEVGREYAVVFQQRTGTAVGHVQRLLADGTLGRPLVGVCHTLWYRRQEDYYAVPWRGKWATEGGGPLLGLGIHQLDLLGFLLGEWAEVDARAFRLDRDLETEDTSTAVIRFANDAIVSVLTTALAPRQVSYVRLDTTLGTVEVEHLYGHDARAWTSYAGTRTDRRGAGRGAGVVGAPGRRRALRPHPAAPRGLRGAAVRRAAAARRGGPAPVAGAGHRDLRVGDPGPPGHQGRPGPGQHPARRLPARHRGPPPGMTATHAPLPQRNVRTSRVLTTGSADAATAHRDVRTSVRPDDRIRGRPRRVRP